MTSKTKTTNKTTHTAKKSALVAVADTSSAEIATIINQTDNDFKNAVLIVSLLANAFILIAWITLKVTSEFDYQIAYFLFYR